MEKGLEWKVTKDINGRTKKEGKGGEGINRRDWEEMSMKDVDGRRRMEKERLQRIEKKMKKKN